MVNPSNNNTLKIQEYNEQKELPGLRPRSKNILEVGGKPNFSYLTELAGMSVLSARQFNLEMVLEICKLAAFLESQEIASYHPLDGKIAITAFFEASTRTRLSFESSMLRLDGKILSVPDGKFTGIVKGESLLDIGEMFNSYGDLVIMRHTETDSIFELSKYLRVPLINAGNGSGEHPTQALADWYALLKWRPEIGFSELPKNSKIRLGILGTPGNMRAVKSFLLLALNFKKNIQSITVVSEMADPLGPDLAKEIEDVPFQFSITNDVNEVIENLDVIYMNSIAFLGDDYKLLNKNFKLKSKKSLKENAVVMHPLARRDELSTALDHTDHNLYFTQAAGAVFVRQALLVSILNRLALLPQQMN